jgi:hypothetical protein
MLAFLTSYYETTPQFRRWRLQQQK